MSENILNPDDRKILLRIARDAIETWARTESKPPLPPDLPESLTTDGGAFVTIHKKGQLRGCIGNFRGDGDLASTVQNMAYAAGWEDPRFPPVKESELPLLDLEISVLSPLREIKDLAEIEVGVHGIHITSGFHRGVLLPQVAAEYGWDRDEFLSHTCVKAGLNPDAWKSKKMKIEIFSAQVFGEKDFD